MPGASWLHVSQSMQVESTKKSPGTFSGKRCCRLAITSQYKVPGKGFSRKGTKLKIKAQRLTSFFFVPWLLTLCLCVKPYSEVKLIDESMQVRTTDPELLRGRDLVAFGVQRAHDHPPFHRLDRTFQRTLVARRSALQHAYHFLRHKLQPERRRVAQHHQPLDQIL